MWHWKGSRLLYETTKPEGLHSDVVPLELCPVISLYHNATTTIQEWVANAAEEALPVGHKSTNTDLGNATNVINNPGLKFR